MSQRIRKAQPSRSMRLAIRVDSLEVSANAGTSFYLRASNIDAPPDSLVFDYSTNLEIVGTCIGPTARAGDTFWISIHSDESSHRRLKLQDIQEQDDRHAPISGMIAARESLSTAKFLGSPRLRVAARPAYRAAIKLAGRTWNAWIPLVTRLVTDMLIILGRTIPVYFAIHESMIDRQRWIDTLSLQTRDPITEDD